MLRLTLLLALFLPGLVHAQMTGQLIGNMPTLASGNTQYCGVSGSTQFWTGTEAAVRQTVGAAYTFDSFRVCLSGASGTGSRAFTIFKNGSATTMVATVTNGTCAATVANPVAVVAGDNISIRQVTTGTLNAVTAMWSLHFTADETNSFPVIGSTYSDVGAGETKYFNPQGNAPNATSSEQYVQTVMPTAGVMSDMYVRLTGNATTDTYVVTLMKNGIAQALTVAIAAGTSTGNDTSNTVAYVAGDILTYRVVNNGSVGRTASVGMKFAPTIDGESVVMHGVSNGGLNGGETKYARPSGGGYDLDASEVDAQQIVHACTMRKMRAGTFANVGGSGQTATFFTRLAGGDTTITCAIASGAAACSDVANDVAAANDDKIAFSFANSASTGQTNSFAGLVLFESQATPTPTPAPTATPTAIPFSAKNGSSLTMGVGR